jgi:hypothetical protein
MINWKIIQLERNLSDGLVTTSHWVATKTDNDFIASSYGSLSLPAKSASDATFVAYADIKEDQAINWTKEAMGADAVAALEANLNAQIEAQKSPVTASGLPWQ